MTTNKKTKRIDIVEVKSQIAAGILFVKIREDGIFLGDYQTGEAVKISERGIKTEETSI